MYAKLAEHGKIPELRGIMLCNDYPPSLKDILADLEKKAYTIRKDSNNKKKTKSKPFFHQNNVKREK